MMMTLYEIPVIERYVTLSKYHNARSYITIEEIGFVVYRLQDEEISSEKVKQSWIKMHDNIALIEAAKPIDAILGFYKTVEGATCGGAKDDQKALRISTKKPILELPYCLLLNRTKHTEEYVCGTVVFRNENGEGGEYGLCVLEGSNPPDHCPIDEFRYRYWRFKDSIPIEMVYGFPVVRAHSLGLKVRS